MASKKKASSTKKPATKTVATDGRRTAPRSLPPQAMAARAPGKGRAHPELPGTAKFGREPDAPKTTPPAEESKAIAVTAARSNELCLNVPPRKPRLAWQGMDRKELAAPVPSQVVEIVRPGLAAAVGVQGTMDVRRATARDDAARPVNRLIWTNDNLVALQTLLDEKEPNGDYRYRGKVDLVYIDPPFMVNSDFMADNAIDIEIDGDVQAQKEPSLVELLAYKDTWRQGLDSFLTMLRSRLLLLKDLLAPTGSIYVHLDWHAVHYVKVLMDEIFGYGNLVNDIAWKRTFARSDSRGGFNHVHDNILVYSTTSTPYWDQLSGPHAIEYIRSHYNQIDSATGRRYQLTSLESPNPRPNMMYEWKGHAWPKMGWRFSLESMKALDDQGLIVYPSGGGRPRYKRFLDDDGMPIQSIWSDIPPVNSQAAERLGYPTQKPVALLERIISASCPPGGLVLDCFIGSGTTAEAAERLGRRWIGIDNGKYGIHLSRKRLIQLHGKPRPTEKPQYDYPECKECGNIDRKTKAQRSPGPFQVRPFSLENMGVYQRAEEWQDFQKNRSVYRDEMVAVFGAKVSDTHELLHGLKNGRIWVHIGPLDGPISTAQIWAIARAAGKTEVKAVDVLSADFSTLASTDRDAMRKDLGVVMTVRIIPKSAIDEVRRRIEIRRGVGEVVETTAIPAFYAPLSIVLGEPKVQGRKVTFTLERCEVDIESFLASQRPTEILKLAAAKTPAQKKKLEKAQERWDARETELKAWLKKATTWRKFVDFWAVDWDYQSRTGTDGKPIFETEWQSFRTREGKEIKDATFTVEFTYDAPGTYQIAARVTDVFGNDGIATVEVKVR